MVSLFQFIRMDFWYSNNRWNFKNYWRIW